jgi:glutathione-regulated potassium-efflux system ancillary protein KefC/glutathione-regulated potassium-efflux system protein KefB
MTLTAQVAVFLAATVIAVPLFRRFKLSAVLGYLAAGVVIGPWGLGLFSDVESILHFAEFGVVLLLFVIGLELQPSRLWVLRNAVFGSGAAQVGLTTALLAAVVHLLGQPWLPALVIGFALSLSSTALVLQVLAERGELTTRHGRTTFAILLFQDLAIMPVLVLLPLAAGAADIDADWRAVAIPLAAVALTVGAGRYLLRPVLRIVAATRAQEAFTAAALLVVVATALLFDAVGLSAALGAFIAGVLLADSEYRHELEADIEPFKGLLLGLFFIAVGMSANLGVLLERPLTVLALTFGYLALKAIAATVAGLLTRHDRATAWRIGVALAGGGEFAFVLLALAAGDRLVPRETADLAVIVVTLSMVLAPLLIAAADRLARRLATPAPGPAYDVIESEQPRVIIAGFGRFGQVVARVLRAAGANQARLLVIAVDDVEASVRIAELARRHFPQLRIFARARNRQHAFRLMEADVNEIWRETFASSLELAETALVALGTPRDAAARQVRSFRAHDEETLRAQAGMKDDEERLIASAQASARQLESLFEADSMPVPETR